MRDKEFRRESLGLLGFCQGKIRMSAGSGLTGGCEVGKRCDSGDAIGAVVDQNLSLYLVGRLELSEAAVRTDLRRTVAKAAKGL